MQEAAADFVGNEGNQFASVIQRVPAGLGNHLHRRAKGQRNAANGAHRKLERHRAGLGEPLADRPQNDEHAFTEVLNAFNDKLSSADDQYGAAGHDATGG